jgi:response regulator RpfG family c-di-GMP phosphodiesterase
MDSLIKFGTYTFNKLNIFKRLATLEVKNIAYNQKIISLTKKYDNMEKELHELNENIKKSIHESQLWEQHYHERDNQYNNVVAENLAMKSEILSLKNPQNS